MTGIRSTPGLRTSGMRRFQHLTVAVVALLVLAACGGDAAGGGDSAAEDDPHAHHLAETAP